MKNLDLTSIIDPIRNSIYYFVERKVWYSIGMFAWNAVHNHSHIQVYTFVRNAVIDTIKDVQPID